MSDAASPDSLRLFVAIELPDSVNDAIQRAQDRLKGAVKEGNVRWTTREQFHITLKFLGKVATHDLTGLTVALTGVCAGFGPITLSAEAIGFFPSPRRPRVVWVGIRAIEGELNELQKGIEAAVRPFSAEREEKSFSGHITLGRVKFLPGREAHQLSSLAAGMEKERFGEWTADETVLLASDLHPEGSRYSTVAAMPFGKE
jgi:2'-5' RNA ligase